MNIFIFGDKFIGKNSIASSILEESFFPTEARKLGSGVDECKHLKIQINLTEFIYINLYYPSAYDKREGILLSWLLTNIKKMNGIILVFDLSNERSFETICSLIKRNKGNNIFLSLPIVVFGNKCDLKDRSNNEINDFFEENNIAYFETSAKENINIKEGFKKIIEEIYSEKSRRIKEKERIINLSSYKEIWKFEDKSFLKIEEKTSKIN